MQISRFLLHKHKVKCTTSNISQAQCTFSPFSPVCPSNPCSPYTNAQMGTSSADQHILYTTNTHILLEANRRTYAERDCVIPNKVMRLESVFFWHNPNKEARSKVSLTCCEHQDYGFLGWSWERSRGEARMCRGNENSIKLRLVKEFGGTQFT